jgi:glutathione S-transferase
MKLYYAQATCSHAPHIALREAGLPFTLVRFDKKSGLLEDGRPITAANPKGYVPVLELDDGTRLTEVAAILQYIADRAPASRGQIAPPAGSMERYRLVEWLHFLGMEIHKIYWPLFHDGAEIENSKAREKLGRSFTWTEQQLGAKPFLMGDTFTVADAYLVTLLNWAKPGGIDLAAWPHLRDYRLRIRERPAVHAALDAEGLIKKA